MEAEDEAVRRRRRRRRALKSIKTKPGKKMEEEEEEEGEALSPAARLFHQPNFNVHIIAIMGSKTSIFPDVVKANLPHTLLKHPRFSSLLVEDDDNGGTMKWVRTKVDLEKHVIVTEGSSIIGNSSADRFVEDYVYNLSKTSIDKSKPLWDLHLLNVKTSDAAGVGIFRIHHSLGDGTSLMSLLLACTRQISDPSALPTIPVKKKKKRGETGSDFLGFRRLMIWIWWVLKLALNTAVDVVVFMATALFLKDSETPVKGRPGSEFTPRRFVYKTVSLDEMKLIKNAMEMTINDVALGITQAGLSHYLNQRYGEGARERKENNLPQKIRIRSTLLVNIRPSSGIQDLADMMAKNTEAKWGNWIGYVLLPFSIQLRDDPLDYLREAKSNIDRKKHSLEALITFSLSELALKLFGIRRASAISHKIITNTTMCFSNLVGPQEEIGFYGHPMAFLAPSSYGQPHALMINFQSYRDKMTIVLSVDEDTIPDPHELLGGIVRSLQLIKDAVIARGLVKET